MRDLRMKIVFFLFLVSAGMLGWRLFNLQIKNGEKLSVLALGQRIAFEENSGERGDILLKNNPLPLSTNKKKFFAYISPSKAIQGDLAEQAIILAEILE